MREAEEHLGICDTITQMLRDHRKASRIEYTRKQQLLQRVIQLALGYDD